jgi:hypothetical protein
MDTRFDLLIQDYAKELAELLDQTDEHQDNLFEQGRRLGLAQAASLLLQEVKAFGIDTEKLDLDILSNRPDLVM